MNQWNLGIGQAINRIGYRAAQIAKAAKTNARSISPLQGFKSSVEQFAGDTFVPAKDIGRALATQKPTLVSIDNVNLFGFIKAAGNRA